MVVRARPSTASTVRLRGARRAGNPATGAHPHRRADPRGQRVSAIAAPVFDRRVRPPAATPLPGTAPHLADALSTLRRSAATQELAAGGAPSEAYQAPRRPAPPPAPSGRTDTALPAATSRPSGVDAAAAGAAPPGPGKQNLALGLEALPAPGRARRPRHRVRELHRPARRPPRRPARRRQRRAPATMPRSGILLTAGAEDNGRHGGRAGVIRTRANRTRLFRGAWAVEESQREFTKSAFETGTGALSDPTGVRIPSRPSWPQPGFWVSGRVPGTPGAGPGGWLNHMPKNCFMRASCRQARPRRCSPRPSTAMTAK